MVDMAGFEGSKRSLLEEEEEAIDEGLVVVGFDMGLTRRRKMKNTMERKRSKLGFNLVWNSETDGDEDDGDVLGAAAMQFGRRNHPPRAHKGSISMNQHQGYS